MKIKIQVAQAVNHDLKDIAFWYNQQKSGLGMLFLKEISKEVHQISKNPLAYELRYAEIRIAFTKNFLMLHKVSRL